MLPELQRLPTAPQPLTARLRAQVVFELHGSLGLGLASRTAHSPPEITELSLRFVALKPSGDPHGDESGEGPGDACGTIHELLTGPPLAFGSS